MELFKDLKKVLDLHHNPVGIKLISEKREDDIPKRFKSPENLMRYCEFVKRAANGEYLKITKGDFSCITGEILLGLKKPKRIKLDMRLQLKNLKYVLLFPINKFFMKEFDSILLIVNPKNCMDIIESYIHLYNEPLESIHGIPTGICGEVTAFVIKHKKINFSFLCSGSRIFAGFDECELLCGIPRKKTRPLIREIKSIVEERRLDASLMEEARNSK